MTVGSCSRCSSPLEREDLRCAVCALPTPRIESATGVDEAIARILRCNGCGAAVQYSAEAQAPKCDFCGSVMEIETPEDPVEQAEVFLDFTVSDAQAREALKAWLGSKGFFRPSDLQDRAAVDGLRPLWWVGWMFDAAAGVCWAADSDAGAGRSAWAPHSGRFEMRAENVVVPASVGLDAKECRALVPYYDLARNSSAPQGHDGATVEQFTVQRSAARRIISGALAGVARSRAKGYVPGSSVRNLHVSVLPSTLTSKHLAFPAFVLAYRYRDKLYRAVVHGQDASCVLGEAPIAWGKIVIIAVIVLSMIALVASALG